MAKKHSLTVQYLRKQEKDYPRLLSKADQSIRDLQKLVEATKAENSAYVSVSLYLLAVAKTCLLILFNA
jgi:hypothetical protein